MNRYFIYVGVLYFALSMLFFETSGVQAGSPKMTVKVSEKKVKTGECIWVSVQSKNAIKKASVGFAGRHFTLFKGESKKKEVRNAFIPISRAIQSGALPLKVYVLFESGDRSEKHVRIQVEQTRVRRGKVTLSKKRNALSKNRALLMKEGRVIGERFRLLTSQRAYELPFIYPAKGRISSPFGAKRNYNGGYSRFHSGLDIANNVGTPVRATNHGTVVLSQDMAIHGQTVMIDHGWGVLSIYNHLSKRAVVQGRKVKKGETIGLMGATGVATGPHVHWGMSIQNIRVDPQFFIQ